MCFDRLKAPSVGAEYNFWSAHLAKAYVTLSKSQYPHGYCDFFASGDELALEGAVLAV